jgi:SAM-dependent methyltransferase
LADHLHAIKFSNAHFDAVISGWVLGYSDTKQKCADEMLRVTKKGGVIALGNSFSRRTEDDIEHNVGFWVGSREIVTDLAYIEGLFGISPGQAYFRYDGSKTGVNGAPMITVFEVR